MKISPFVFALLLAAQVLLCLHEWIPHSHQPIAKNENSQLWDFLQRLISTNLGESHLENLRPSQLQETEEQVFSEQILDRLDMTNQHLDLFPQFLDFVYLNFKLVTQAIPLLFEPQSYLPASPCSRHELIILASRSPRGPPDLI